MRLYYNWRSICSSMVHLHILEKGIVDCELSPLNLEKGEQLEPWFIELNPKGQVPVLVDGERVVPDSLVISLYLESEGARGRPLLKPEIAKACTAHLRALHAINFFALTASGRPGFVPAGWGDALTARVREHMRENPNLEPKYAERLRVFDEEKLSVLRDAAVGELHRKTAEQLLGDLEQQAERSGGPWIFGEELSVLDAHVIPFLARLWHLRREPLIEAHPRMQALWALAQVRPSFRAVYTEPCDVHGQGCFCK